MLPGEHLLFLHIDWGSGRGIARRDATRPSNSYSQASQLIQGLLGSWGQMSGLFSFSELGRHYLGYRWYLGKGLLSEQRRKQYNGHVYGLLFVALGFRGGGPRVPLQEVS